MKMIKFLKNLLSKVISSKVDVSQIVIEHYSTLYNYRTDKKGKDIFTFFGIPLIVSIILVFFCKGTLDPSTNESILLSLTIFTPIMFSLLVAIYSVNRRRLADKRTHKIIKQFKSNVSFMMIISVIAIFFLIINSMHLWENQWYSSILIFIILFLLGIIGLTFLLVLKRWNHLLDKTLDEIEPPKEKIL